MYRKGVDLLVGLIPVICARFPHVDFIVGGSGPMALALNEQIEREQLQGRVKLCGSVPHARVRDVLVSGDVFLNCSLTESFCIAILEAACCGLMVVSTNVGGVPEVLPPDRIVMAEPNVPALVEALVKAIEMQEQMKMQVSASEEDSVWKIHRRLKDMYSWSRVANETVHVYDAIQSCPPKTLRERLACYNSIGSLAGWVACFLALTIELWYHFVRWWMPQSTITICPDLKIPRDSKHEH